MQILRNAHLLARFVLVWFVLSLSAAVASPLLSPQAAELICFGAGITKFIAMTDDGVKDVSSPMLDCPWCATGGAPPPSFQVKFEFLVPLGQVLQSIPSAFMVALTAAPPPARGPPSVF